MKKIFCFSVIICALIFLAGCNPNDQYAIEKEYWWLQRQISRIFKNPNATPPNELERAVDKLQKFSDKHPKTGLGVESEFNIARLYIVKQEYEKARTYLKSLMDKYKESKAMLSELLFMSGNSYEIEDKWSQALEQYKQILREYPLTLRGFNVPIYIAQHYKAKYQPDKMVAAYQEAIGHYRKLAAENAESPFGFKAKALVAQTYIFLSDWQNAVTALQETIEKYKDKISMDGLMMDMALIYNRELKDKVKARETLQKLLAEYPDSQLVKTATAFLKELDKK